MKRKYRMPKYEILSVQEDELFNSYLEQFGVKSMQALVQENLNIPDGFKRYETLIRYKGEDKYQGLFAKDALDAWARIPAKLKQDWYNWNGLNRYDRPKTKA
jgi:hypothetical protein